MAKKNYNKISTEAAKANVELEKVEVTVTEEAAEPIVEETVDVPAVIGVVSGCTKLNVRYTPNIKSNVVKVLDAGTEVEIEPSGERKDFYEVCAVAGADYFHGFCMKKYITIKK